MLVSYGLLAPLALLGFVSALRRSETRFWSVWLVVHLTCIYLPTAVFPFQRKMSEGLHVVLATKILDHDIRIVIENLARIHQAGGVEDVLDLLQNLVERIPILPANEGGPQ